MKRFLTLSVLSGLIFVANMPVFAQKSRAPLSRKTVAKSTVMDGSLYANDPVRLGAVGVLTDGDGIYLNWEAEYETANAGFLVRRVSPKGVEGAPGFVGGAALTSAETTTYGGRYSYYDGAGTAADFYYIESLATNGERRTFGPFAVQIVKSLKKVAGQTGTEMRVAEAARPTNETTPLSLTKDLSAEVEANSIAPDLNMQRWVANQPGVKIGVKQQGFYRVTRTELQNGGFDVNSPSSQWQLFVDGIEQSIIVAPDDSYIEFYGRTLDTPESAVKVYYLITGSTAGKRIGSRVISALRGVPATGYSQTFERRDRVVYLSSSLLNGDEENFFGSTVVVGSNSTPTTPATANFTFTLTAIDTTSTKALLSVRMQGISAAPHQLQPKLNGQPLAPITGNGIVAMTGVFEVPTSLLVEGVNTLQMQAMGGGADINLLDRLKVSYARRFVASQNRVDFYTTNYRSASVSNFTSANIRVFDMTAPDSPIQISNPAIVNNSGNYSVTLPSNRGRVFFAGSDTGLLTASSVIRNFPSALSTTAHNAQMIIVTHRDWITQAEDWANYRRGQGISVEVVDVEDVYDEYSYGSLNTLGITNFLQYAKNNWQTPPEYVLMMGDATYDFRNYENRAFQSFVPTERVDTVYEETGSDEAMCDFDNDGVADLAVGRIPARSGAVVTQLLTKTQSFEAALGTAWARGALFASDLPNGYDFEALSQRVSTNVPVSIPRGFINRAQADSRNVLLSTLNSGKFFVNYSGHGSTGIWDGNWFTVSDAPTLTNSPNYSMYFMLTCLNGYFLRTADDSLGESILKANNGGGVAVWASTGKTTPDVQEVMATRFYSQFGNPAFTRLGDLVNDAKRNLNGGRDVRLSWALLGDPALKIKP